MTQKVEKSALISSCILASLLSLVMWAALGMPFFGIDYFHLIENISYLTIMGGFCGGIAMFVYVKPNNLIDGFVRSVICIMAANMLTQLLASYLTKNQTTGEMWGVAFMVGFMAFPVMSAIARFFENRKSSDISDIFDDLRNKNDFRGFDRKKRNKYQPPIDRVSKVDNPDA